MGIVQLDEPRPLNDAERAILDALLTPEFPGSAQLWSQMPDAVVVGRCDCGCPTVNISVAKTAPRSDAALNGPLAPYEGRVAPLSDEPVGDLLLFVNDGYMSSLEYVFYTDTPPMEWPRLDRVEIVPIRG
jgi:hypothetical protein